MKKIAIINGPNINMLGYRETEHYGSLTYKQLVAYIKDNNHDFDLEFFQSNHEGAIVDFINKITMDEYDGIVINPAAYSHTSIAIMDALAIFKNPKVEVHLSDVKNREAFRQKMITNQACDYQISNHREEGYIMALAYIKRQLD